MKISWRYLFAVPLILFFTDASFAIDERCLTMLEEGARLSNEPVDYTTEWQEWFVHPLGRGHTFVLETLNRGGEDAKPLLALGFRTVNGSLLVPSLPRMMAAFGASPVRPGIAYSDPKRADAPPIFRGILEPAPPGLVPFRGDRLPEKFIGPMLQAGFYPLAQTRLKHDFMHNVGFFAHPEFARVLQELEATYSGNREVSRTDRNQRFSFLLEAFAYVPARNREALIKLIGPEFADASYRPTLTTQTEKESRKTPTAVRVEAETLLKEHRALLTTLGGAAREWDRMWHEDFVTEALPSIAQRLRFALDGKRHVGGPVLDPATELARLKVALHYSVDLTPEKYLAAVRRRVVDKNDPVYLLYVTSGIGAGVRWRTPGDGMMQRTIGSPLPLGANPAIWEMRQTETERLVKSNTLEVTELATARKALVDFAVSQRIAMDEDALPHLSAHYAVISRPADRIRQMLRFARDSRLPAESMQKYLDGSPVMETLDLTDASQRSFLDLVESLTVLRKAGMGNLIKPHLDVIRAEAQRP